MSTLSTKPPSNVIYLGDIPFDMTQDQVQELASTVGPVKSVRLVYNNETKKFRGYGFIEYSDVDTATNAVRNFRDMPFRGRKLRADFSQEPMGRRNQDYGQNRKEYGQNRNYNQGFNQGQNGAESYNMGNNNTNMPPPNMPFPPFPGMENMSMEMQMQMMQQMAQRFGGQQGPGAGPGPDGARRFQVPSLPQIPPALNQQSSFQAKNVNNADKVPSALIVDDNISRTLSHLPPPKLLELISTLRLLVGQDAAKAHQYFKDNMDITYSVVQAMLLMGFIDNNVVSEAASIGSEATGASQHQQPPQQRHSSTPTPPPPPPPPPPPAPSSDPLANMDPQQAALIRQVLELTDSQINSLPADQKNTIVALREQYKRGIYT